MRTLKLSLWIAILMFGITTTAKADNLLTGKKWSDAGALANIGSGYQGAAYFDGKIYQFCTNGTSHGIYTISSKSWAYGNPVAFTGLTDIHCGSACFDSNAQKNSNGLYEYKIGETSYTSTYPLLFVTGHTSGNINIKVIDYATKACVATLLFPHSDTRDDMIAAYDFAGGKIYILGYPAGKTGLSPWNIWCYSGIDFKNFSSSEVTMASLTDVENGTVTENVSIVKGVGAGNDGTLVNGTLQDCQYVDDKIYFVVTRGCNYNRVEFVKVHAYDTKTGKVVQTSCTPVDCEPEGFVYDYDNKAFYFTTGTDGSDTYKQRLYKLSAGTGYDALNFEPASLGEDGYYQITTPSQFVWFKQQVYCGCTSIKAKLMNNIDMTDQTDPYTYYVDNSEFGSAFNSFYSFSGEFDGQSHTISGIHITTTPFYNDGVFPYVKGANIHDLTVTGNITATAAKYTETGKSAIQNVGFIGTMDGGTLTNINAIGLNVSVASGVASSDNVNTIIGREKSTVTQTNCLVAKTHSDNGGNHMYVNGFCACTDASASKDGYYETPTKNTEGYYEIDNAGKLWYFAKNISTLGYDSKLKLTADINMEGSSRGSFPGIGTYSGTVATEFHGTFDGNGKTISNFYMSSSARCGLFNSTMGTSTSYATIKNFTIKGEMTVSGTATQRGSIVGYAQEYTLMEDITSSVNITCKDAAKQVGGIAGRAGGIMNRCRYNGTLNAGSATTFIGGIAGEEFHYNTGDCIENCLFDGKIIATANSNLKLGGIGGGTESSTKYDGVIKNCLSKGIISLSGEYSGNLSGIVTGASISKITISDTYYLKDATSTYTISDAIGSGGTGTVTGTPTPVTNASDLTNNTLLYELQQNAGQDATTKKGNWIAGASYPIPGVGDIVEKSHHYDDNGYCTDEGCTATQPMGGDFTNGYTIANAGQLATFRDLVSSSAHGTQINAKLTQNISLSNWTANDMIGSVQKPYCGTFDGQGYTISDVNINPSKSTRYVGLFACVGVNGTESTTAGIIENLSVSGSIKNEKYYCNQDVNDPLEMGVIGDISSGSVINVHSSVNFGCTTATRAQIGGVIGGVHMLYTYKGAVSIEKCSYTGTIDVNAFDDLGGIIGYIQHNATVSNCLFNGHIKQAYDGNVSIPSGSTSSARGSSALYSQIGGILGYISALWNEDNQTVTKTSITNNLVTGDFTPDKNFAYQTSAMNYDHTDKQDDLSKNTKEYHNINAVVGYTKTLQFFSNNYLLDTYTVDRGGDVTTSQLGFETINSENTYVPTRTVQQFDAGEVCAEMNGNVTDENPWGQVLGYQLGWDGKRNCDPNSPSELYPSPGYTDHAKTINKVVRTQNSTDNAKYDYTADYYFFDDYGDMTPMPTDAASMKVKKIKYTRRGTEYMKGYISVCLPYDLKSANAPKGDTKYYEYAGREGNTVKFTAIELPIAAGKTFIMYNTSKTDWAVNIEEAKGTDVKLKADDYDTNVTAADKSKKLPEGDGLYGTFNTRYLDNSSNNFFKLNDAGTEILKATTTFHCWPFRAYFKLPALGGDSGAKYSCFWGDEDLPTQIEFTDADGTKNVTPIYNIIGQQVSANAKGIVIKNGKKYIRK